MVLAGYLPPGVDAVPTGNWEATTLKHPRHRYKEEWLKLDRSDRGWMLWLQRDRGVLKVRLSIPRLMNQLAVTNYPLKPYRKLGLVSAIESMREALGFSKKMYGWLLNVDRLAVIEAAFTMDLFVADKAGMIGAVAALPHAGKRTLWETTVQWASGDRRVQLYDKLAKTKSRKSGLPRKKLDRLLKMDPDLAKALRFEVTLKPQSLRTLFGIEESRLPVLELVGHGDVIRWVIYDELANKFKLANVGRHRSSDADRALGVLDEICAANPEIPFPTALKLMALQLLQQKLKKPRDIKARYPTATSPTISRLKKELRDLGLQPGGGIDPDDKRNLRLLRQIVDGTFTEPPTKPRLNLLGLETKTAPSPWMDADDIGVVVDDVYRDGDDFEEVVSHAS